MDGMKDTVELILSIMGFMVAGLVGFVIWKRWGAIAGIVGAIISCIIIFNILVLIAKIFHIGLFLEQENSREIKPKEEKTSMVEGRNIEEASGVTEHKGKEKNKDKKMEYFECDVPSGDGVCSDNDCPCPEVVIPRGTGYLYIDQDLVDFRHKYPIMKSAREAMQRRQDQMRSNSGGMFTGFYRLGPILVCEQGAKLRNLDLEVAAEDAKYWWETGKVPLRATPIKQSTKNTPKKKSTVRRKQKRCAKCGKPLSESIDFNSTSSGTAILGGGQFWEMMSEKFSLAMYCKKCEAYYCAGCALEAWQKGGEERFICPRCSEDLGDASIIL